jgi:hypothetical protein
MKCVSIDEPANLHIHYQKMIEQIDYSYDLSGVGAIVDDYYYGNIFNNLYSIEH